MCWRSLSPTFEYLKVNGCLWMLEELLLALGHNSTLQSWFVFFSHRGVGIIQTSIVGELMEAMVNWSQSLGVFRLLLVLLLKGPLNRLGCLSLCYLLLLQVKFLPWIWNKWIFIMTCSGYVFYHFCFIIFVIFLWELCSLGVWWYLSGKEDHPWWICKEAEVDRWR